MTSNLRNAMGLRHSVHLSPLPLPLSIFLRLSVYIDISTHTQMNAHSSRPTTLCSWKNFDELKLNRCTQPTWCVHFFCIDASSARVWHSYTHSLSLTHTADWYRIWSCMLNVYVYMYACACVFTHSNMYTCMHAYIHTYIQTNIHAHSHTYTYIHTYILVYLYAHLHAG